MKQYFMRYANCLPVTGASRSVICDLQRGLFHFIPTILAEKLLANSFFSVEEWMAVYNHEHDDTIEEYIRFLIDHEMGMMTSEPEKFPVMSNEWKSPGSITNAIIYRKERKPSDLKKIISTLQDNGCVAVNINYLKKQAYDIILSDLEAFNQSGIKAVTISLVSDDYSTDQLKRLFLREKRLHKVTVFDARHTKTEKADHRGVTKFSERHPGKYYPKQPYEDFAISIPFFTESLHHHTYFNRKVFINDEGEICNTGNFNSTFGHIETTDLQELLRDNAFTAYYNIRKNDLPVCNRCEFRNICMDRRIPVKDKKGNLVFEEECGYNPDIMKWKNEEGYEKPLEFKNKP